MILVTGASGFIGTALFEAYGPAAVGVQRAESEDPQLFAGDLTNDDSVSRLIEVLKDVSITHIVHTAAVTPWSKDPDYSLDMVMAQAVNRICRELNVQSLIFVSGWNVYDMTSGAIPFSEDTPLKPIGEYAQSKYDVEQYFANNLVDTKCVVLRTTSIYGAGQTSTGLIPNLFSAAGEGGPLILRSLNTKRDYLHIGDFVEVVMHLTENQNSESDILNIGSGRSISVLELAETIQKIWQEQYQTLVEIEYDEPLLDASPIDNQLDISKAQSRGLLLKTRTIESGLIDYIEWKKR